MADSRPSTAGENKRRSFFPKRKSEFVNDDSVYEKDGNAAEVKPAEADIPSISFTELFRSVILLVHSGYNIYLSLATPQHSSSV